MAELIEDGKNGLLFTAGCTGDLARCIIKIAQDRALLERLVQGIQPVPGLNPEIDTLIGLYSGLFQIPTPVRGKLEFPYYYFLYEKQIGKGC